MATCVDIGSRPATTLLRIAILLWMGSWVGGALLSGCRPAVPLSTAADVPDPPLDDIDQPIARILASARDAARDDPAAPDAWGEFGIVLDAHGFTTDALACYRQAGTLAPENVRWPYLAATALAPDDPRAATAYFALAAEADPASALVRHGWGDALLQLGEDDAAGQRFQEALDLDPDARRAMLGLAELALRRDDLDRAAQLLDRAAELNFYERGVHAMRARLHRARSDQARAEREALFALAYPELAPVDDPHRILLDRAARGPKAHTKRGLALAAMGRPADAERAFRVSLQLRPSSVRNRLNLAGVIAQQGRTDEAIDLLQDLLADVPYEADAHNHLAVAMTDAGRLDHALARLHTALTLDPRHDRATANRGRVHELQGRAAEAIQSYRAAVRLNPVNADAHRALAKLLEEAGRPADALPHWRDAADFGYDDPETVTRYAMAASRAGAFGDALEVLRRARRRAPDDPSLLAATITILSTAPRAEDRDGDEALQLAGHLLDLTGSNHVPTLNLMAAAQAETGDFAGAIRTSEQALVALRQAPNTTLARIIESRLARYRRGEPFHQRGG